MMKHFNRDEPELSDEHNEYKWAAKSEALEIANSTCQMAIEKVL